MYVRVQVRDQRKRPALEEKVVIELPEMRSAGLAESDHVHRVLYDRLSDWEGSMVPYIAAAVQRMRYKNDPTFIELKLVENNLTKWIVRIDTV